jgi:3-oxoacyl-[acyl-carrier-protein] synthase-3
MLSIQNAAYAIPDKLIKIVSAYEWLGLTKEQAKIYQRLFGLETFPCVDGKNLTHFLIKSIDELFQKTTIDPLSIKYIIHAHTAQVLCQFGKSIVAEVKKHYQLNNAIYFGTSLNNCGSIFNALDMANILLDDNNSSILILVGDITFTQSLRIVPNVSITGDAAGVMLVNKKNNAHQLKAIVQHNHGQYAEGMWLPHDLQVDFEKQFLAFMIDSIHEVLRKANLSLQDIALIIPHNVNVHFWRDAAKALAYPFDRIVTDYIKQFGHCFGTDVVINWVLVQNKKRLKKGDYYLAVTAGLGVTLCAAVFQY